MTAEAVDVLGLETSSARADFDDALSRAFARIEAAKKDKKNPHFKSSYADLASVTEAIRGPLTDEGFSWPQTVSMEDGMVVVTTHLCRKGVELCSVLPMPLAKSATPQAVGSAITYARRYGLSALVGVAPDDDDGNAASSGGGGEVRAPRSGQQPQGPWRSRASKDVLAADEAYRALCKQRAALQRELKVEGKSAGQRIAELLGHEMPTDPGRMSLDKWDVLLEGMRGDVEDLQRTKLEAVAGQFDGEVESEVAE